MHHSDGAIDISIYNMTCIVESTTDQIMTTSDNSLPTTTKTAGYHLLYIPIHWWMVLVGLFHMRKAGDCRQVAVSSASCGQSVSGCGKPTFDI